MRSVPFRWYFAGQIVSASGTFVQQTAIAWLVLGLTGSASSLGIVIAVGGIPPLLLGPWGGVVTDRFDLRRLLIVTQALQCLLAVGLWMLAWSGLADVPVLIAIGSLLAGWICSSAGPRAALLVGASACLIAAGSAARVHTPPHPDDPAVPDAASTLV
ncbi:MFS transporter [Nocardia sp. CA-151230]|uniref:MFS transporter n=1 Tax=Nocardia sp. CA-151230 TaxID=3239982 RepID=UPI003D918E29